MISFRSFLLCSLALLLSSFLYAQDSGCAALQSYRIVVIGSSTAAGSGANPRDSSWVNRYQTYLQGLHPDNEVINLARGGYNTYRLMPDDFQAPTNRPQVDSSRNVSAALRQSPNAIILNLPSNDTGSGFSVAEQLSNFEGIVQAALQANVPIWLTTTQPRNFSAAGIAKQLEMRDSLQSIYAPFIMDFWSPIANTAGIIDTLYDSGDGIHVNNTGHRLLFEQAIEAMIPDYLYSLSPLEGYRIVDSWFSQVNSCGGDQARLNVSWINLNDDNQGAITLTTELKRPDGSSIAYTDTVPTDSYALCEIDTFSVPIELVAPGNYEINSFIQPSDTSLPSIPAFFHQRFFSGLPTAQFLLDTVCVGETALLTAQAEYTDRIFWYGDAQGNQLLSEDFQWMTNVLDSSSLFYVQLASGLPYFSAVTSSTDIAEVQWNGYMFDVLAKEALSIDSLAIKIHSTGAQDVRLYRKQGSHRGFERDRDAWEEWEVLSVFVADSNAYTTLVPTVPLQMAVGDSLALYIQMANSNATLSYQRLSDSLVRESKALSLYLGSGSNYNFGGPYFPREWNGRLYYHYGERPLGDCATDLMPVEANVSMPFPYLGADTVIFQTENLVLQPADSYESYQWSTGEQSDSLDIQGADFSPGLYTFHLEVTDKWGCTGTDSIQIQIEQTSGVESQAESVVKVYPTPGRNSLTIGMNAAARDHFQEIFLIDIHGRIVLQKNIPSNTSSMHLATDLLPDGNYLILLKGPKGILQRKWQKMR
ncbi:MAG: GDSL-type esterase/lipase family protein [Bacteroidota bacterium]